MSSSSNSTLSLDHHFTTANSDQLCYVHCNICETVLAVSVPCTSLFKTVTVRCGHCSNLLSVNMQQGVLLPSSSSPMMRFDHGFFSAPSYNFLEQMSTTKPKFLTNNPTTTLTDFNLPVQSEYDTLIPRAPHVINKPPEKRQRMPSAYNRFIKEEIQRIKAVNPGISHREAFSAAAKNWAHFPNIQFGLMPADLMTAKETAVLQQEGENVVTRSGLYSAPNIGVSPY